MMTKDDGWGQKITCTSPNP